MLPVAHSRRSIVATGSPQLEPRVNSIVNIPPRLARAFRRAYFSQRERDSLLHAHSRIPSAALRFAVWLGDGGDMQIQHVVLRRFDGSELRRNFVAVAIDA